jgi:hypothetical protein
VSDGAEPLADALLRAPVPEDIQDPPRGALTRLGRLLVGAFILYHATALLLHTTPSGGLARDFTRDIDRAILGGAYIRATSNVQSWSMFAPNPHRANVYVQVFVEDREGAIWDLAHDSYGRRTWPYIFYDRIGKLNRRLSEQGHYLQPYGAYVCREWERTHGGEPAARVKFVKIWTNIPPPHKVFPAPRSVRFPWSSIGFDPMRLPVERRELESVDCRTTRQAQLSPELRQRFGLPPAPEGHYRPLDAPTWWDKAEAERRAQERGSTVRRPRPIGEATR